MEDVLRNLYELFDPVYKNNLLRQLITFPNKCPVCNRDVNPNLIGFVDGERNQILVLFHCTLPNCKSLFFRTYNPVEPIKGILDQIHGYKYQEIETFPIIPKEVVFSNEISSNFPEFVRIYNQAHSAEVYGLSEVAGMGYRKAVEFLVKDFLINKCGNNRDDIEKKLLGTCINQDIEHPKIKACAERAAWLGNDEFYYKRKWEEKDVNDLKSIIKMLVNFIEIEIQQTNLLEDMPEGR